MGGLMSITGTAGQGPMRVGIAINDLTAGGMLAFAIMVALFDREHTGVGRWVYTSLIESQVFMLDFQAARYLVRGDVAEQAGNDHPTSVPQSVFATTDIHINIAAPSGRMWEKFCVALDHPEWLEDPEWKTSAGRSKDRERLHALIADIVRQKPSAHWLDLFAKAGIPSGPIFTIDRVFDDAQMKHLGMAAPVNSPIFGNTHFVASPVNMSGVTKGIRHPAPDPGAHTDEILDWLGYSQETVGRLRNAGVV